MVRGVGEPCWRSHRRDFRAFCLVVALMSAKTQEEIRDKVVELRKSGLSRSKIHVQLQKEMGAVLSPPTLNKILREAGLTDPARDPRRFWKSKPMGLPQSQNPPIPVAQGDGISHLQPPATPPSPFPKPSVRMRCSSCHSLIQGEVGESIEKCPGCGERFD